MDSATAALIGTSVGAGTTLIAGVAAPWLRDKLDATRRDRMALRDEITDLQNALGAYLLARAANEPATETMRLGLAVERIAQHIALNRRKADRLVGEMLMDVVKPRISAIEQICRADACMETLRAWYFGEIKSAEVTDEFAARESKLRSEAEADTPS